MRNSDNFEPGPAVTGDLDEIYRALQHREAELALVQRIAGVGGVEVDLRDGFDNRRSPEYLLIHGLPPSAANESHTDWVNRIHPEDRAHTEKRFLDAIKSDAKDYSAEYRIIRPSDGQTRWISVAARIERDADGRAVRLVGAHIDVTERMTAQLALRESEERFRLIANNAPVPMWVTTKNGERSFVNRAYLEFFGLSYEQALKFDWRKLVHPDDIGALLRPEEITAVARQGASGEAVAKTLELEMRLRRCDGEWRWARSVSQARFDGEGRHAGFIGVAQDITVAKQAEIELRKINQTLEERIQERTSQLASREAQMRAIFETSNLYQGLLDVEGRLLYANKTALAGIRAQASDVLGQLFWETRWFSHSAGLPEKVQKAFASAINGEVVQAEVLLRLPIGDRLFDFAMRPILDQNGIVSGVVPEALDITDRRQSEEVLRRSQRMEAIGQLTGGVAHDFNNLLTVVRSGIDLLQRSDLSDERRQRYIAAISDAVDRGSRLTNQLLAFARRQPLKPQLFNVGRQVESIAQLLLPAIGNQIDFSLEVKSDDCHAMADLGQFEAAVINLAVNARDAMPNGGHIKLNVERLDKIPASAGQPVRAGQFVAVSLADTGMGIAPEQLELIFEPFFTTKDIGKGTGLGLSQAFGFAQQSGGELRVVSTPAQGSTFTIYLPEALPRTELNAAYPDPNAVAAMGGRILVVEDSDEIGALLTEQLAELGYEVDWAKNANEALVLLSSDSVSFDLVFSDIIMPGMNGIDLAKTIRRRYSRLPVVLTTGYSDVTAENAGLGFEVIQKPYALDVLDRAFRRAIHAGRAVKP